MARRILLLGCLIVLASSGVADAQRRTPNYRSRPVLSPYTNLFRGDNGGLNSYFSVVRPRQVLNDYIREANYEIAAQQQLSDQRALMFQQELEQTLQGGSLQLRPTTGTGTAIRKPAGTFMNYSTYFRGSSMGNSAPVRVPR